MFLWGNTNKVWVLLEILLLCTVQKLSISLQSRNIAHGYSRNSKSLRIGCIHAMALLLSYTNTRNYGCTRRHRGLLKASCRVADKANFTRSHPVGVRLWHFWSDKIREMENREMVARRCGERGCDYTGAATVADLDCQCMTPWFYTWDQTAEN